MLVFDKRCRTAHSSRAYRTESVSRIRKCKLYCSLNYICGDCSLLSLENPRKWFLETLEVVEYSHLYQKGLGKQSFVNLSYDSQ